MRRRRLLAAGCAHCALLGGASAGAFAQTIGADWALPQRFGRPDAASDEGGLWAMMDREEARLRRSPFAIRDAALREYLQGIAIKLAPVHGADMRVYPVRTPMFNASMAPNGMMQVWSGLLLRAENEAQLAAVLGHEIGHYLQRHTLDALRDAKARSAFGMFVSMFGVAGMLGNLAILAGMFGFSRDQERQADAIGVRLMHDAGYDPREASKVWLNLRAELAAAPGADAERSNPLFATHPASAERSETLARLAENAKGGELFEAEYAAKLAPLQFDMLDDEVKRGQYSETMVLLDRMVARQPQRGDLLYFRAETRRLRAAGPDLDNALLDIDRAIGLGNEPVQVHRSAGYIHQKRANAGPAREAFERYLQRAPQAPDAAMIKHYLDDTKT